MSYTERPMWIRKFHAFMVDTIVCDDDYPDGGTDDAVHDKIEEAVNAVLCTEYGHQIEMDQCGIPSHSYCVWCQRGITDIEGDS